MENVVLRVDSGCISHVLHAWVKQDAALVSVLAMSLGVRLFVLQHALHASLDGSKPVQCIWGVRATASFREMS